MTKNRTGEPWMPAPVYGRSLKGFGVNLLVRNIEKALAFEKAVLGAEVVYADADFAVVRAQGGEWMLHADHTYGSHPLLGLTGDGALRGAGIELRVHGRDPDLAEAVARKLGYSVLAPAADKPHGLREAYLADDDGYIWVPDTPIGA